MFKLDINFIIRESILKTRARIASYIYGNQKYLWGEQRRKSKAGVRGEINRAFSKDKDPAEAILTAIQVIISTITHQPQVNQDEIIHMSRLWNPKKGEEYGGLDLYLQLIPQTDLNLQHEILRGIDLPIEHKVIEEAEEDFIEYEKHVSGGDLPPDIDIKRVFAEKLNFYSVVNRLGNVHLHAYPFRFSKYFEGGDILFEN